MSADEQKELLLLSPYGIDADVLDASLSEQPTNNRVPRSDWGLAECVPMRQCLMFVRCRFRFLCKMGICVTALLFLFLFLPHVMTRIWASTSPMACPDCAATYYTAVACVLGGQRLGKLTSATVNATPAWRHVFSMLSQGSPVRAELEALFDSHTFKEKTRCPQWMTWDDSTRTCLADSESSCPSPSNDSVVSNWLVRKASWRDSGNAAGKCTANLYFHLDHAGRRQSPAPSKVQPQRYVWAVPCSDHSSQQGWRYEDFNIVSPEGLCVAYYDNYAMLEECSNANSQWWDFQSGSFINHHGACLNILGVSGPRVGVWNCNDDANERFTLDGGVIRSEHLGWGHACLASLSGSYAGTFGGECTCPDGGKYFVTDGENWCKQLKCYGGLPGSCSATALSRGQEYGAEVVCQQDFVGAASLKDADPAADCACWNELNLPRFVERGFLESCPGYAPEFTWPPASIDDMLHGRMTAHFINFQPSTPKFSDFEAFYAAFYATAAGDVCRHKFGLERPSGLLMEVESGIGG